MNNNFHILNGDALKEQFPEELIADQLIVVRECLIDGNLEGENLEAFWETRAQFIMERFGESPQAYEKKVVQEFQKILNLPQNAELHFWFEDDLFCMCNFWFSLSLLSPSIPAYIVKPKANDWNGFGAMSPSELYQAYRNRQLISNSERALMLACWQAYKAKELKVLQDLSKNESPNFPLLAEVCQAHLDRFPQQGKQSRPAAILYQILSEQSNKEFRKVFPIFHKQAGIYGFGDVQVKRIYDQVIQAFE